MYTQYNSNSNMYYIYERQIMVSKLLLLFVKCTFNAMIIFEQCDAMQLTTYLCIRPQCERSLLAHQSDLQL